jgi:tryptophanyl-tRNA synthetase
VALKKGEPVDRALKRLKTKLDTEGILEEMRRRRAFESTATRKIRKARTDAEPLPETLDGLGERAEAKNLVTLYAALADISREQVLEQFGGQGFGAFKPALADVMVAAIAPITARFNELRRESATLDGVLADGAARARAIAEPVLAEVHRAVGFTA